MALWHPQAWHPCYEKLICTWHFLKNKDLWSKDERKRLENIHMQGRYWKKVLFWDGCFLGNVTYILTFHSRGIISGDARVPWHPHILADQLTLSQPGWKDYAHLITTGTPVFSDLLRAKHSKDVISPPNGLKSHSITQESIRSK